MPRTTVISAATLALVLTACSKAPTPSTGNDSQDQSSGVASATSPASHPASLAGPTGLSLPARPQHAADPAAPNPPAPTAAVVTYDCHSPQKSRDIFVRFDADGTVNMGEDAKSLTPIGVVIVKWDKDGVASWSEKLPNGSETNSFNRTTGEWDWRMLQANGEVFDSAQYACKAL